jgi:hypothetical protein
MMADTQTRELTRVQRLSKSSRQENTDAQACCQRQHSLGQNRARVAVSHRKLQSVKAKNPQKMYHSSD